MGKTIRDILTTGLVITELALPLSQLACTKKIEEHSQKTNKQIAIEKLESVLSGEYVQGKVLSDTTYTLEYNHNIDTLKMSIKTLPGQESESTIYKFSLNMLPSYVEIEVVDGKANVTDKRP